MGKGCYDMQNSEKMALEIVAFLRKWGLWRCVQIFAGGKCYSEDEGTLQISVEGHPEKYTEGIIGQNCNGESEWKDFSNPERLLDMTFEGPLSLLLRHHEYEVRIRDLSIEAKNIIMRSMPEVEDEVEELMDAYLEGKIGWDPAEYDSYEEWLELNQYCEMGELSVGLGDVEGGNREFASREEYKQFIFQASAIRENQIREYFEDVLCDSTDYNDNTFFDDGSIANHIINDFNDLFEKYGLRYELGFSWSLTAYRI
ncbi:MAG: hypothetical protein ACI4EF_04145 [Coprococcus sp.]